MKKCPYCAEEIQDEAVLCRFCGKSLNTNTRKGQLAWSALGGFAGCINAFVLVFVWNFIGGIIMFVFRLVGYSFGFPLVGYVIGFFAGTVAGVWGLRKNKFALVLFLFPYALLGLMFFSYPSVSDNYILPTPTLITAPTKTIKPAPKPTFTLWPRPATPAGPPGCILWSKVTKKDIDKTICVWGKIYTYGPYSDKWTYVKFSPDSDALQVMDFNYYYVNPLKVGDCIAVNGKVRDYGSHLMITPHWEKCGR